jgi:membrane dipeptidase
VLIENADPVSAPDDLDLWRDGGVVAVGLTWMTRGRYASGNGVPSDEPGAGLTDLGRAFVARMDELGLVHDASHLNDRSLADLFDATDRRVVATHSNCRALFDPANPTSGGNQRHLTDDAIREIARRGGVIGLNLCSSFLDESCWKDGRASIDDCLDHVEHVCEITGNRDHVALGSDMDGGFSAARLPNGVDLPADLSKIAEALRDRGWSDAELAKFTHANWARVFPALAGV